MKIMIAFCVFQFALFGQNDNKDHVKKDDLNAVLMNETTQRKFDIYIEAGAPLFKIAAGLGYFINNNFEGTLKFGIIFVPLSVEGNLISVGMKHYENPFSTITYSLQVGALFSQTESGQSNNLNGVLLEANIGYSFQTGIGIYISPSLGVTYLARKGKEPGFVPGINLLLGWILVN